MITRLRRIVSGLPGRGDTVSSQMAHGGMWVFGSYGLQQAITVIRSIILARLLTPTDFGLMGLAALATAAVLVLTETGTYVALLQRKTLDRETQDTAWIVMAVRGFVLSMLLVLVAPLVARFFAEPQLTSILRVLAWVFLIGGLNSLGVIQVQRDMHFEKLAYLHIVVAFVSLFVWVGAALVLRSVWALVIGELVSAALTLALSYRLTDYRPRLHFSRAKAKELMNFGKYLTGSGIITYLATQGDDVVVGRLLGTQALGYYGVAYRASNLPATSISHVINRVTVPGFSRVQDDTDHLRALYLRTLRMTALLIVPFAGGMFAVARYFVPVLYGDQWTPAIPAFMVLCFFGLERAIGSVAAPVFLAKGRTRLLMFVNLSKLLTMAVLIVPLTLNYDIVGTSIAVTASAIVVQTVVLIVTARLLTISVTRIGQQLIRPFAVTALMMAVLFAAQYATHWSVSLGALLVLTGLGFLVYVPIIGLLERQLVGQAMERFRLGRRGSANAA